MALQLPKFLALKSYTSERYLQYIHQDIEGLHGILQSFGEEVLSPYAKFQVEAETTGSNLVHIRSCYNNKYLRRPNENQWWIVAGADEPEANQTLWSCTLFEPELVRVPSQPDRINLIRLRHVQLRQYIMPSTANEFRECLYASQTTPHTSNFDVFTFIDRETLVNLPKHIAFKGDNGNYLSAGQPYLRFSVTDHSDPTVANEVFITGDGNVRIKSTHTQHFWRRNRCPTDTNTHNYIWADSNDDTANNSDVDTVFFPVKVSNNSVNVVVALRNLGNNNVCERVTKLIGDQVGCLNAALYTITLEAHLAVKELVLSRTISNIKFRLDDARIYNRNTEVVLATGTARNPNQQTASSTIPLSYVDTKESTWNTSADDVAFTSLIQTTLTSATLFVVQQYPNEENIEALANFSGAYQWGHTHTSNTPIESQYPVFVPPMTQVTVSLRATKASCDIPFDYSQEDTLISRPQPITYHKEGGVYTGVSFSNVRHVREEERLPQA